MFWKFFSHSVLHRIYLTYSLLFPHPISSIFLTFLSFENVLPKSQPKINYYSTNLRTFSPKKSSTKAMNKL